jgi:hypothetical protein
MRVLTFFILLVLLSGCDDDKIDATLRSAPTEESKEVKPVSNNTLHGLNFSLDSINRAVIIQTNRLKINQICSDILRMLVTKNKQLEYKNNLSEVYCFLVTQDKLDSLAYFGYPKETVGEGELINLAGTEPYKNKNMWERVSIKDDEFETKHPTLFKLAADRFFEKYAPRLVDERIALHGVNYIDYEATLRYKNNDETPITFRIANESQKLVVTVDKFGVK